MFCEVRCIWRFKALTLFTLPNVFVTVVVLSLMKQFSETCELRMSFMCSHGHLSICWISSMQDPYSTDTLWRTCSSLVFLFTNEFWKAEFKKTIFKIFLSLQKKNGLINVTSVFNYVESQYSCLPSQLLSPLPDHQLLGGGDHGFCLWFILLNVFKAGWVHSDPRPGG